MTIPELYKIFKKSTGVATDSRKIHGGELFFALKGENFDGNEYAVKALEEGAGHAVIDCDSDTAIHMQNLSPEISSRLIPVENTLKTLQDLARWHRSMTFVNGKPLPVIGLTGTNGKTTTKELIKTVLSVRYNVTATEGNLNNSIGVPLSGLITNVGKAHLLGFGSFEGVKKAKGELYDYIQRTADKAFINADNPDLCRMAEERPDLQLIPYGLHYQGAEILPSGESHPYLRIALKEEGTVINTHLIGSYNADNVMAAMAVGQYFGVTHSDAAKAIEEYIPSNNRSQMVCSGKNTLIIDAYNANPSSMDAAIRNFREIKAEHKVLMLGDMLELGADSAEEHRKVLEKADTAGAGKKYFVGEEFWKAASAIYDRVPDLNEAQTEKIICSSAVLKDGSGHETGFFLTSNDLAAYLAGHPLKDSTVLIKGSRGTRMETVTDFL